MPVSITDHFAELDHFRIHYRSAGSVEPAIIFLSGWGCDTSLWRNQVPALADRSRLLLIDLPGHGQSDHPDIDYTPAICVRAVSAAIQHARVTRPVVAGHSMGAMVAYEYARRFPENVAALAWVEGTFAAPVEVEQQMAMFRKHADEFRRPDYREKVKTFLDSLFVPETPAPVRDEVERAILAAPQHVLAGYQQGFADPSIFVHQTLDLPAFALWSAFWRPEQYVGVFRKVLPRLEYEILTGVGHYPMLEKPGEVTGWLARILEKFRR